jgi:hypothetical protein
MIALPTIPRNVSRAQCEGRSTGHRGSSAAKDSIKAGAVEPQPDARRKGALEVDLATLNFVEYLFHATR